MKRQLLLICLFLVCQCAALLAQRTITGKITDDESGEPLVGATVVIKGTKKGTLADVDGLYTLNIPNDAVTLVVSYTGYDTKEVAVGNAKTLDITLKGGTLLQEVVVTGYGIQIKRDITGAISHPQIKVSEMTKISGKVAGVSIANNKTRKKNKRQDREIDPINTSKYAHFQENSFQSPVKEPLSTFSIDVDKTAYANMRRFINDGQKPNADAIRIEEMINYFDYKLPHPTSEHPVIASTEIGTCPWNTDHYLLKIDLQATSIDFGQTPSNNLVFLIDVSGSMQSPNKLGLLKHSFNILINQMREHDYISIVTYAGSAGLVLPPTSGVEKETILKALNNLEAGGSTAGGEGIELAYKIAEENYLPKGNNRVILATDGDFNVGVSSTKDLENLIVDKREKDIYLSVLGYGDDNLNDEGMETLADKGNGNYFYIDNEKEAEKVFVKELQGTILTVAKDVKFQIEFNPNKVESYRLVGYENRVLDTEDFNNDKKDAGEIGAGNSVTAFYEIVPKGVKNNEEETTDALRYQTSKTTLMIDNTEWGYIKLRYKKPLKIKSTLMSQVIDNQVVSLEKASDNFRFAASVAAFGQLLRDSKYKGKFDTRQIINLAQSALGADTEGYRKEFIALVEKYIKIVNSN